MILRYDGLNTEWELPANGMTRVSIEASRILEDLTLGVYMLLGGEDAPIHLIEDSAALDGKKLIAAISGPQDLVVTGAAIKRSLLAELVAELQSTSSMDTLSDINKQIGELMESLAMTTPINIDYDVAIEEKTLLDSINVHVEQPVGVFVEKLEDYIVAHHRLLGKQIFFAINCRGYLDEEDYPQIKKFLKNEGTTLIMIDGKREITSQEDDIIIDEDLCEI